MIVVKVEVNHCKFPFAVADLSRHGHSLSLKPLAFTVGGNTGTYYGVIRARGLRYKRQSPMRAVYKRYRRSIYRVVDAFVMQQIREQPKGGTGAEG